MNISIRPLAANDLTALGALLCATGVFEEHEIRVAEELLDAALAGSPDYTVCVAAAQAGDAGESPRRAVMGYVCYGRNPVTDALFDVYWIAVDPSMQGHGAGCALLSHAEACVRGAGGRGLVIDTSSRAEYQPAHQLYARCGFQRVADVPDYYKPGDSLILYMKVF
jgi:ribosomal protein S18 acetylase RimI-like enzyme